MTSAHEQLIDRMRDHLTERQVQVLRLMLEGEGKHRIGRRLSIDASTARHHIDAIRRKLAEHGEAQVP